MRFRIVGQLLVWLLVVAPLTATGEEGGRQQVRLVDHLEALRAQGVRIIYSSDLVSQDMMIQQPVTGGSTATSLGRALAPTWVWRRGRPVPC